jgi:ornithine cyclodeaminase/alanine dehydrogenase-like protein (mu-crystallin family)
MIRGRVPMAITIPPELFRELTPWARLIEAIAAAFREPCEMPARLHFPIPVDGAAGGSLLLMPAWVPGQMLGVKIVQVFPGNAVMGKAAVHGVYMLASAVDGHVHALVDAQELTARRTAATSALASRFLSHPASTRLLVLGTGRLALNMVAAHATVRSIRSVAIWGRNLEKAENLAARIRDEMNLDATAVESLNAEVPRAHIISTVTMATEPLLRGCLLAPGTHVDLVGGFTPRMREADDDVLRSARIYVDNLDTAPREAGDLADPIERGVLRAADLQGDLFQLCQGRIAGRRSEPEITVFKSVGVALEDLAASTLAYRSLSARPELQQACSRLSACESS